MSLAACFDSFFTNVFSGSSGALKGFRSQRAENHLNSNLPRKVKSVNTKLPVLPGLSGWQLTWAGTVCNQYTSRTLPVGCSGSVREVKGNCIAWERGRWQ